MRDRIITIAIYFTIFISSMTLFSEPFELQYSYLVMLVLFPFFIRKHGFPIRLFAVFIPLVLVGFAYIYIELNTVSLFLKIFLGLFFSTLFYYYVARAYNLDVDKMFGYYMDGAVIIAWIGLAQFIAYSIGFSAGYDYQWLLNKWGLSVEEGLGMLRVNSVFFEPSTYAMVTAPATFFAIWNIIKKQRNYINRVESWLILLVYLLTFSTVAYLGLLVMFMLIMFNFGLFRYSALVIPVLIMGFYVAYENVPGFQKRMDSTYALYSGQRVDYLKLNSSSVVSYNNYRVAVENFKRNPLFGTGLGSHPIAFEKYSITKHITVFGFASNPADANSMFSRLMSETGLMGLGFMFFFIFRFFIKRNQDDPEDKTWLISAAILTMILLYLLRQGHYFLNGFPFFMWLYYYNSRLHKSGFQTNKAA